MAACRAGDRVGPAVSEPTLRWQPPEGRHIALPSGSCFYREAGGGAPPIVLLHGLPDDSRVYGCVQPILSRHHRTLAPDLFGWGVSEPNEGLIFGFDTLGRNLAQFLDAHGLDDVVLVAQDMSGPAAVRWAAANPARMRALVLLNTYYGWNSARMPPVLKLLHMPYLGRLMRRFIDIGRPGLSWYLYRWQVGSLLARRTLETDRLLRRFHTVFRRSRQARRAFHAINDELVAQIDGNQRRLGVLTGLQCPTLIAWGQRDRYLGPPVARQFHRLVPGSELRMIPDAGHLVQLEAPDALAELIIGFIARHPSPVAPD